MADDSPNRARIQSMLDDLAQKRQGQAGSAGPPQAGAASGAPATDVPGNLPTSNAPTAPKPAPPKPAPPPTPKPTPPTTPAQPDSAPLKAPPKPSAPAPAPTAPAISKPPPVPPRPPVKKEKPPEGASPTGQTTTEIRTMAADVQQLSTGQAPAPVKPTATGGVPRKDGKVVQKAPPTPGQAAPGISIPKGPSRGMNRKLIYGGIGVIVLLIVIFAAVSFLGGEPEPVSTPTPIPTATRTPSPSPTPAGKDLSFYFGQLTETLRVPSDDPLPLQDFQNRLRELVPTAGQATNVEAIGATAFPATLSDAPDGTFGRAGAVLVFGQTELFNAQGQQVSATTPEPRLVYIFEVANATAANQMMQQWERGNLAVEMAYFFNYEAGAAIVTGFSDATYRQIPVRYQNYPFADRSVDWAIVPASNNINYLVITGSRESMFFAVDQLLK